MDKLYTIVKDFYNTKGEVIRTYTYNLKPMNHHEACTMLNKLTNHKDSFNRLTEYKG